MILFQMLKKKLLMILNTKLRMGSHGLTLKLEEDHLLKI